ncbi:MAG: hypothetical protein ACAI35_20110 [Candidatus Methylacidiphilales bacterium]|nr:hypothetical protein [Candidatus Methylacidiphilales bacterium]
MSNLAKVFGVIAVLGSGAALGAAYMLVEKHNKTVADYLAAEADHNAKQKVYADRRKEDEKNQEGLKDATAEVGKASSLLDDTKRDVTMADKRVEDLATALKSTQERLTGYESKSSELDKLWEGADPKEFNQKKNVLIDTLNSSKTKNTDLQAKVIEANKVATAVRDSVIVARTPAKAPGVRGRVLTLNRTWNFAVLNIGSDDGIATNSTLFVYRNRQLIGKLRVSSVEKKIAIGDVIPESTNASIQPGDEVFQ